MTISPNEMKRRIYQLTVKDSSGNVEYYASSYEYAVKIGIDIRNLRTSTVNESMAVGDSSQPVSHNGIVYIFTRTK